MQKKLSILLLVAVFAAILIFFENKGLLDKGFEFISKISSPISIIFSNTSNKTSGTFNSLLNLSKLQKENAQLKDNLNKLQAELAQLTEAKKENEKLRKDLGFLESSNYAYETAEVVAYDPSNLRGSIMINKGSKSGLSNGMAVISEGFLVGRLADVKPENSKVQLITDPNSAIPVMIQSSSTNGIARGQIGYGISMEKIPQGQVIKEGDIVVTSGLGGEIPKGLILGKITQITKKENSLFVIADIKPETGLNNLSGLIIIKK